MRAELFSSDFIISFFIFLTALIIITTFYQNLQTDISETSLRNDMYSKSISIAGLLATTSGYPQYWNSTNVQVIGLYDSGKFNLTKFEYLINETNYQTARSKLGVGRYDFLISMKNSTGGLLVKPGSSYYYSYGNPLSNQEQVVLIKRLGVVDLDGNATKVVMEVILWL